jgi:hypothetical protein
MYRGFDLLVKPLLIQAERRLAPVDAWLQRYTPPLGSFGMRKSDTHRPCDFS